MAAIWRKRGRGEGRKKGRKEKLLVFLWGFWNFDQFFASRVELMFLCRTARRTRGGAYVRAPAVSSSWWRYQSCLIVKRCTASAGCKPRPRSHVSAVRRDTFLGRVHVKPERDQMFKGRVHGVWDNVVSPLLTSTDAGALIYAVQRQQPTLVHWHHVELCFQPRPFVGLLVCQQDFHETITKRMLGHNLTWSYVLYWAFFQCFLHSVLVLNRRIKVFGKSESGAFGQVEFERSWCR